MRRRNRSEQGQTLIIALLILGILLVLGVVFAGIINRSIVQTGNAFRRSQATDLADAGVRLAHYQLQYSTLGADWRPEVSPLTIDALGFTRDPDAYWLRPAPTGASFLTDVNGVTVADRGGPDGLGPYSRVSFDKGRALIRVRYVAGQLNGYSRLTDLRQPGRARNYIVIESIGRPGKLVPNDPTVLTRNAVKVDLFANLQDFNQSIANQKRQSTVGADTRRLVAYASIGIIEHGWYITDKFKGTRPAEIGALTNVDPTNPANPVTGSDTSNFGVTYEGQTVRVPSIFGGQLVNSAGANIGNGTGSIFSNASLVIHGDVRTTLDPSIGDVFATAGTISVANSAARLQITRIDGTGPTVINLAGQGLTSTSTLFGTQRGVLRDGVQNVDGAGYARSVSRKEAPSFLVNDPATGQNRYATLTRLSGRQIVGGPLAGRNTGQWGHGRGIYVDSRERANFATESDREAGDAAKSLVNDWLTPNNPNSVAWKGPFYIPVATYLALTPDGFTITRDTRSSSRFWRRADGTPTGDLSCRYRILYPPRFPAKYIVNSIEHPDLIDQPYNSIPVVDVVNRGWEFNGMLEFEGDVRVRGVIPTLDQLTVHSQGSIYIEGSITKGIIDPTTGTKLNRPSPATLMLAAKDFVAVNTTMFFGPSPGQTVNAKRITDPLPTASNPVELGITGSSSLAFRAQFLRNPVNAATGLADPNPLNWAPYASSYQNLRNNQPITTSLLLSQGADNTGPSFIGLATTPLPFSPVASDPYKQRYLFDRNVATDFNVGVGSLFTTTVGRVPIYGLTNTAQTAFPRQETVSLPLVDGSWTETGSRLTGASAWGTSMLALNDESEFEIQYENIAAYSPQNYVLSRIGMQPFDVRIEAAVFAEEGSFFVIPGPAFNVNVDDTRSAFEADLTRLGTLGAAQQERYRRTGSRPETPFFGEPLNVRVTLVGAISENMPVPIAQRAAWQRNWGWMPRNIGCAGDPTGTGLASLVMLPRQHVPNGWTVDTSNAVPNATTDPRYVPNLITIYDPVLALGSADGNNPVRTTPDGRWALPPMPRLPVSPTLAYFGEVNP
ncbi:MAG: hypothetical protein J0L72_06450 [Armatimonadetes bacterium]|nr:hypothetical protein [Armatimonadota bacterium]